MSLGVELLDQASATRQEFDWSDLSPGTISSSAWTISPQVSSVPSLSQQTFDQYLTSVLVSGISWGVVYRLTNIVTTNTGTIESRSITIYGGFT